MQVSVHDEPISLGFGQTVSLNDLFRLQSHYLPLGKIGGKPAWLNPKHLPPPEELECKVCKKSMCFMMQVYATGNSDPVHSFHRTLFFFLCRNPECSKPNDASNICVLRCGLPRENQFYSSEGPIDPDLDGDLPNPLLPADAPNLCVICGCYASKKCGKCGSSWYCCRDHQALDWTSGHKSQCGHPKLEPDYPTANPANRFLFKEMGIEMDQEYVPGDLFEDLSDDDEGGESVEEEEEERRRIADFKKYVALNAQEEDLTSGGAEGDEGEEKDTDFERFHRLMSLSPDQVLRYSRGGTPLPATSKAPPLPHPDPCHLCGGPREFELQLTPHLLSLLEVDAIGKSIDWASVYVFTCKDSCQIPNNGYAREFVAKQDFVE